MYCRLFWHTFGPNWAIRHRAAATTAQSAAHGLYVKNVNKKVGGSLKTEQQPAENEWKIVVE